MKLVSPTIEESDNLVPFSWMESQYQWGNSQDKKLQTSQEFKQDLFNGVMGLQGKSPSQGRDLE